MLYLAIFFIATFLLFEYFETIYKDSDYYKEDVFSISYIEDSSNPSDTENKLKIKEL